jgi:hypothetical protein
VARGSTLMNIIQQIGGSVGAAVMSVILTSQLNGSKAIPGLADPQSGKPITEAGLAMAVKHDPALAHKFPVDQSLLTGGLDFAAHSFATTFWVGFALVLATFIPVAFLPRRREKSRLLDDAQVEPSAAAASLH